MYATYISNLIFNIYHMAGIESTEDHLKCSNLSYSYLLALKRQDIDRIYNDYIYNIYKFVYI